MDRDYQCPPPEEFIIEIGNLCNLRCRYCPTGNRAPIERGMMSFADFERIFNKIKPYAHTFHLYNFGEPFLNKDLLRIVSLSAGSGVATHIDTNLTLRDFSDSESEAIVGSGLSRLVASIDGASQETYELYRIGGSFERATRNLAKLANAKARLASRSPELVWKFLIHAYNEHEMETARQLAKEIGVHILFDLMDLPYKPYESSLHRRIKAGEQVDLQTAVGRKLVIPESSGSQQGEREQEVGGDGAFFMQASAAAEQPQQELPINTPPIRKGAIRLAPQLYYWCLQPFHTAVINFNGDLYPCCNVFGPEYALGNLHEQSLEQIWNNAKTVACRRFILGYGPKRQTGSICETLTCPVSRKHVL